MATRQSIGSDGLTQEQRYVAKEYRKDRLTRRKFIAQGVKAGLVGAISVGYSRFPTLAFAQGGQYADHPAVIAMKSWKGAPPEPTSPITITDWAEAGAKPHHRPAASATSTTIGTNTLLTRSPSR